MRIIRMLVCGLLLGSTAMADGAKARIYVVKPKLVGVGEAALPVIFDTVAKAAEDEGVAAMTESDVKELVQQQATLQAIGGDADELSLASLAKAVGAQMLLAITVAKIGDDTRINARLIDAASAKVLSRKDVSQKDTGGELVDALKAATRLALAPVFEAQSAMLVIKCSEEGANVLVDDQQIGVSPVAPLRVGGGTHLVTVVKEGFIRFQETLRVEGKDVEKIVALRPSPDFVRNWRSTHGTRRGVAWAGTIGAVVFAGAAVYTGLQVNAAKGQYGVIAGEYNALAEDQKALQKADFDKRLRDASNTANQFQALEIGGAVIAGVGALAAAWGWISGEDPSRYAAFEQP